VWGVGPTLTNPRSVGGCPPPARAPPVPSTDSTPPVARHRAHVAAPDGEAEADCPFDGWHMLTLTRVCTGYVRIDVSDGKTGR